MIGAEDVVHVALAEVAIVDARGEGDGALDIRGHAEFVADEDGASGGDAVVERDGVDGPDFVVVDEAAVCRDRTIGEAVRARVERAIGLEEAAVINLVAGLIFDAELEPAFVEVAHFRDERVADVFVLDDDEGFDGLVRIKTHGRGAEGGGQLVIAEAANAEDVDVEIVAGLEEGDGLGQLFVEAVVIRHCGVAGGPVVGGEGAVLGAGLGHGDGFALHVAGLAGLEIGLVERQRRAVGEFRILPLVIRGEGAEEFVVVERAGQVGLVAGGAKLGRLDGVAHHGLGVPVRMREDLLERNFAGDALALRVRHDGGNAEDEAAVAVGGLDAADGVAEHAGQAVLVHLAINMRILGEAAGEDGDGIVAAVAVARELDALGVDQNVDALAIERRAEGVGVQGLPPLVICLLMAVSAIRGVGKGAGLDEGAVLHHGVAGGGDVVLAVAEVVIL